MRPEDLASHIARRQGALSCHLKERNGGISQKDWTCPHRVKIFDFSIEECLLQSAQYLDLLTMGSLHKTVAWYKNTLLEGKQSKHCGILKGYSHHHHHHQSLFIHEIVSFYMVFLGIVFKKSNLPCATNLVKDLQLKLLIKDYLLQILRGLTVL